MGLYGSATGNPQAAVKRLRADLGSTSAGKGAALVKFQDGTTVQDRLPVDNLKALAGKAALKKDGLQVQLGSFFSDKPYGGGPLRYNATRAKSEANGVTVYDLDNVGTLTTTSLGDFHSIQGTGGATQGVWERLYDGDVLPEWAGARDGEDSTIAVQALVDAFPTGDVTIRWDRRFQLTRTSGQDYCVLIGAVGHWSIVGKGEIDIRASEASAGRGCCGFAWRGSNRSQSLVINGPMFQGANAGTNADGVWANPRGSLFCLTNLSTDDDVANGPNRLRHLFVHVDYLGSTETAPHLHIKNVNAVSCSDVPVIIANADSPTIDNCRFKNNGNWAMEIGQAGDRSFAGNALNGTASNYSVQECIVENNDGGILVVAGRGGRIHGDFEQNDGRNGPRSDAGTAVRAHVDFTGTGTSGTGDQSGGHLDAGSTFSGNQMNVKARGNTTSGGAMHIDGNPCISQAVDNFPAYMPFERYQSGVTTKIGQIIELTLTGVAGDFTTGETVSDDTTGAEIRVTAWDSGTGALTGTWQNNGAADALFGSGNGVTGGTSAATATISSIALTSSRGVIVTPTFQQLQVVDEVVGDNATGVQRSSRFSLDHEALVVVAGGLEDSTGAENSAYIWYLRDVTASSFISTLESGKSWEFGLILNNGFMPILQSRGQEASGQKFAIFVRNTAGAGTKNLTGFLSYTLAKVNWR